MYKFQELISVVVTIIVTKTICIAKMYTTANKVSENVE